MRARAAIAVISVVATAVAGAITPPSASDGPVKLLTCVVTSSGALQAEVSSQADETLSCEIRCNYELGARMFSQSFTVGIPARFQGRLGELSVPNARPGNYSGDIGRCTKP